MKTNTSVKTSCTLFSPPILPPLLFRAFSIFTSWRLACSPALLLSCSPSWCVRFIHWRGCVLWWQHRSMCVWVLVRGCVLICACVGWSVVSLLSMRHTSRHTCTHRGGGCCVRTEGAVGVLSELDLGFLFYTSQSGCYGIVEYCCCVWAYMCAWIREGVDQNWKQHYDGSYTYPVPSLSELSFFFVFRICVFRYEGVGAPFQRNLTRYWYSTMFRSLMHSPSRDIIWWTGSGQYVNPQWMPAVLISKRGDAQWKYFPSRKWSFILHFNSLLSTTQPICKYFSPPAFFLSQMPLHHEIQSLLPYLSFRLLICE